MSDRHEPNAAPFEDGPVTPERLGTVISLVGIGVFTSVDHTSLNSPAIGAFGGCYVGSAIVLFLPLLLRAGSNGGFEAMAPTG
ncbi:hypothetical protein [Natrialba asiatica]|uniref:Amino acid permease n=1 Tax=Natrialba asiatica (strain ATCC 700177 / DSM 12278 / JCM 9576 / FERM P-10747 / NBRC 102637 / 172P1) TaxID=29540 RepID=M0AKV0_NATA1|nr:hypothetical protein [Natrialba asiatica]ELY99360.1 hypothetical protein C481_15955 [Natrialba asiatica DSM 12278]